MPAPKRVLCIMDMSGVGRSSLSVVLPVLAACGVQASPLATSLFSTHTGGFGTVNIMDSAAFGLEALAHYERENIGFDAVYTGYLQSDEQFLLARKALEQYPAALKIVDPAMGDHGKIYSKITPDMVLKMQSLCLLANVITPNCTESALLLNEDPSLTTPSAALLVQRINALSDGTRSVLITSAPNAGEHGILGLALGTKPWMLAVEHVPQNYPGTGDLFAACTTGLLLNGYNLKAAASAAGKFVSRAAAATYQGNGEVRHGVWFEPFLKELANLQIN